MKRNFTHLTKRIAVALSMLAAIPTGILAQTSGGPDTYGYIWRDSNDPGGPAYNWKDITTEPNAIEITGLADDNIKGPFTVGFPFHYYWYDVTTFRIGSNGYLGFTSVPVAHPFPVIPSPTLIQNYIAAMTSDLTFVQTNGSPVPGAECWMWTSPGADSLVVSYINVPFWIAGSPGFDGANTFQIILSGVDSSITFQYQQQTGTNNNPTNFCTIGIENITGNIGLMHSHDVLPPSSYAIKFYYPQSVTFAVTDAATVYNNNEETGGFFLSSGGAPFTLNTQIKNTGNQPLAPFQVSSRVLNSASVSQVTSNVNSSVLAPGQTEDITFPATYSPGAPGEYRYINDTQLPGDATPSNNQKVLELQVVDTNATNIVLAYDNGVEAGLGGLAWQGGLGGAGVHIIPPFYPCNITELRAYIVADANATGFAMLVLDDDGPNGSPGTVLDSVFVDPASVIVGSWNIIPIFGIGISINSGGFYVAWSMGGDGVSIGQNQVAPFSYRTYEILGQASNPNAWAVSRYRELEDLMIQAVIQPVTIGLNENQDNLVMSRLYPNPATGNVRIDYQFAKESDDISWTISDLNGRQILNGNGGSKQVSGSISIDVSALDAGVYVFTLRNNGLAFNKKLTVVK